MPEPPPKERPGSPIRSDRYNQLIDCAVMPLMSSGSRAVIDPATGIHTRKATTTADGIYIKITGGSLISGYDNRWEYTWAEQRSIVDGRWEDKPGGLTNETSGFAYNTIEANNAATGVQGNSIDIDSLPTGFTIVKVQGNPVVFARRLPTCDGTPAQWHFSYENAVQGECPE